MTTSTIILLILIGLLAGVFSGIVGLGGGLIIIPALIYLLHMDQYGAQGTSLAMMLPPIGLLAAFNYYRAGALNIKYAMILAVAFFIGGYFGSRFALSIPADTLRKIFAFALILVAARMLWGK
ncbi:MAG: sulfite exporter TauE/SafE family protein [Bacteroidales bacterium]|nr:sulfite exporter TauE/SafE family protein [Bacteroidales bacterium]MDP2237946.1 sulfite exporter TauE/SafE family protein [Bacteroidales bacterium]